VFNKLLPKEDRFFVLFKQQTASIQEGIRLFEQLSKNFGHREQICNQIKEAERKTDSITHEVHKLLNKTFVTPFDREDIYTLVNRMDDVIDCLEATATRLQLYDISSPPAHLDRFAGVLRRAFESISDAIAKLGDWKNRQDLFSVCVQINTLEEEGDQILRDSLRLLFSQNKDPIYILKVKEIYEKLEEAIDCCEDIADVLETILLKNA